MDKLIITVTVAFRDLLPPDRYPSIPFYAGLTPTAVGLYQINVIVPDTAPHGDAIPIYIDLGNNNLSNRVNIAIQ